MTKPLPGVFRSEIRRAYERGDKVEDIERDFDVAKGSATKIAKADGVPLRRPRKTGGGDGGSKTKL